MDQAGPTNSITDVPGLLVGNADDLRVRSGVTVVLAESPAIASIDIRGGGTGTRDTELLSLDGSIKEIDAIVLSGGSAFGLDAAGGAMSWLREQNRGLPIGNFRVPIVPQAIIFDLLNGGQKNWGRFPPYWNLGYLAIQNTDKTFPLGNIGAGMGAQAGLLKGGLGSSSVYIDNLGVTVGAIMVSNPAGEVLFPNTDTFFAWDMERNGEYGGKTPPHNFERGKVEFNVKSQHSKNTTIGIVATDAILTKSELKRFAIIAQDGIGRAIRPAHTPMDGDIIFSISTGKKNLLNSAHDLSTLGAHAANCVARSIARGVYEAKTLGENKAYQDSF